MNTIVQVIILANHFNDAVKLCNFIEDQTKEFEPIAVHSKKEFIQHLTVKQKKIILSEYHMEHFHGLEALVLKKQLDAITPFLFLSENVEDKIEIIKYVDGVVDILPSSDYEEIKRALYASYHYINHLSVQNAKYILKQVEHIANSISLLEYYVSLHTQESSNLGMQLAALKSQVETIKINSELAKD